MQFRVLGSLEVCASHGPLQVVAPRQRTVLAMLMLEANRIVSTDRLIAAVWDDNPPATARGQIQICVSTLRRLLTGAGLADIIVTRPPGYALMVPEDQLDLRVFENLATAGRVASGRGRLAEAVELYGKALKLWRGEPLTGMSSITLRSVASRLVERHLTVVEDYGTARLQLGDHELLAGELAEHVAAHPLRERLCLQFMLALSCSGRRAEALECYRRTRSTFIEELGLEPGLELQRLERAILLGDEGNAASIPPPRWSAAPVAVPSEHPEIPRQLPAAGGDFAGRRELLDQVREVFAGSEGTDHMSILVLSGAAGLGKTALAIRAAHDLSELFPDGQLYLDLAGGGDRPAQPAAVLERFLRALGVPGSSIPDQLDERAALFRSRVADRRILVVLDDAADENQVYPVLPGGSRSGVLITSRVRLTTLPGVRHVQLDPLDRAGATQLLAQVLGAARIEAELSHVHRLAELCGYWPMALRIVAARLAAREHWSLAQMVERLRGEKNRLNELVHGPLDVRASFSSGYRRLCPAEQRMFRLIAALPPTGFPSWVGGPLSGLPGAAADALLESLVDRQLLQAKHQHGPFTFFRLPTLPRLFAVERLSADEPPQSREQAWERAAGGWLSLLDEAHRRVFGSDPAPVSAATGRWELPADLVNALLMDPMGWYDAAKPALLATVQQAAKIGAHEICWSLVLAAARFVREQHDFDRWNAAALVALRVAERAGHATAVAELRQLRLEMDRFEGRMADTAGQLNSVLRLLVELGNAERPVALHNIESLNRIRETVDELIVRYEFVSDSPPARHNDPQYR
jgi:DNA-binding SARP family transcriptional activator